MPLAGSGEQLRHRDDGQAEESVRLADLLSLVPHLVCTVQLTADRALYYITSNRTSQLVGPSSTLKESFQVNSGPLPARLWCFWLGSSTLGELSNIHYTPEKEQFTSSTQ